MKPSPVELETLIHDVHSKCSSLRSAVEILKDAPEKDAAELLKLMAQQADSLAQTISDAERRRSGK